MKFLITVFLVLILKLFTTVNLLAQAPDTLWTRTYGGDNWDRGESVQQTSDGGYIIAGLTKSYGAGNDDVYLIKTDSIGDTLWTKTFGGTDDERGYSVQQTSDEGYIITGETGSYGAGSGDVYLIKTDSVGDTLWTKTYGGTKGDRGESVQQTSDGGYIIAGWTKSYGAGSYDIYLIKTYIQGSTQWIKTYGGTEVDMSFSVQQTSDGGYIIAGLTKSYGAGNEDVYLIKTDSIGDTLWTKTFGGTDDDFGSSVQQTTDGGYIITGSTYSYGAGNEDVYLIKTDSIGDTLWIKTCGGSGNEWGYSIQQTSDEGYIITGQTNSYGAGSDDVYLIKTDSVGDTLWTKTCGGTEVDRGESVQQTSDGGYIIAGWTHSYGAGYFAVYLIKVGPSGGIEEEKITKHNQPLMKINVTPNPFMSMLRIDGLSKVTIYDISGKFVVEVKDQWDGKNSQGQPIPPGIYFLKSEGFNVGKVVKVR